MCEYVCLFCLFVVGMGFYVWVCRRVWVCRCGFVGGCGCGCMWYVCDGGCGCGSV